MIDEKNGVIVATGTTFKGDILDCAERGGLFENCHYNLSVSLESEGEDKSVVSVRLEGNVTQKRRKHFLIIPLWLESRQVVCGSTGRLEHELFAHLQHQ